ncbi:MAG: hypothetical protein IH985_02200 [Planctomycetes bacterium]|nr:hypothetical protein [Planctomycetota bacterium]
MSRKLTTRRVRALRRIATTAIPRADPDGVVHEQDLARDRWVRPEPGPTLAHRPPRWATHPYRAVVLERHGPHRRRRDRVSVQRLARGHGGEGCAIGLGRAFVRLQVRCAGVGVGTPSQRQLDDLAPGQVPGQLRREHGRAAPGLAHAIRVRVELVQRNQCGVEPGRFQPLLCQTQRRLEPRRCQQVHPFEILDPSRVQERLRLRRVGLPIALQQFGPGEQTFVHRAAHAHEPVFVIDDGDHAIALVGQQRLERADRLVGVARGEQPIDGCQSGRRRGRIVGVDRAAGLGEGARSENRRRYQAQQGRLRAHRRPFAPGTTRTGDLCAKSSADPGRALLMQSPRQAEGVYETPCPTPAPKFRFSSVRTCGPAPRA